NGAIHMIAGDLSDAAFHVELEKRGFKNLKAGAYAEATVYSLSNPYLSRVQKAQIEAVYQLPLGAFTYALILMLLANGPSGWLNAYLVACAVSIPVWAISWFMPGSFTVGIGTFFAGSFSTIGCLALGAVALYQGQYSVAVIAAAIAFLGGLLI